jgi:hypothetical protein
MTDVCTGVWSTTQSLLSSSSKSFATATAALAAAAAGAPPGSSHGRQVGGDGRSVDSTPPVSPAPGGPPSGAASGGAAVGGSGLALSGFFTLACLLLLGAPRAMRRLRLACEPWLTACFVLIPERPG